MSFALTMVTLVLQSIRGGDARYFYFKMIDFVFIMTNFVFEMVNSVLK